MTNKVHVNDKMTKKERGFHSSQWCIYRNLPLFFGYPLHLFHCSRLVTAVVYVTSAFRGFIHQGWAKKTKKIRENTTFLRYKTNYSLLMKYCWGSGVFSDFEHSPLPYRCQERQTSRVVLVDSTLNPTLQRPKTTRRLPRPRVLRKITVRTANFWPNRCSKHATSSSTRHAEWWESHTYGACECYLVLERCGFSGPFALLDSQKPRSHAPSLQPFTARFQPRTQGLFGGGAWAKESNEFFCPRFSFIYFAHCRNPEFSKLAGLLVQLNFDLSICRIIALNLSWESHSFFLALGCRREGSFSQPSFLRIFVGHGAMDEDEDGWEVVRRSKRRWRHDKLDTERFTSSDSNSRGEGRGFSPRVSCNRRQYHSPAHHVGVTDTLPRLFLGTKQIPRTNERQSCPTLSKPWKLKRTNKVYIYLLWSVVQKKILLHSTNAIKISLHNSNRSCFYEGKKPVRNWKLHTHNVTIFSL